MIGTAPWLLFGLVAGALAGVAGFLAQQRFRAKAAGRVADAVLADARREAETVRKVAEIEAKEEALRRHAAIDAEAEAGRREVREQEKRLAKRDDLLDQKLEHIHRKEREFESVQRFLAEQQEDLNKRNAEVKALLAEQRDVLHRQAGLPPEEARALLMRRVEDDLRHELGGLILRHEQTLRETSQQKAREILATAIQRFAASHTAETTVSTVDIPSDDMKGRIIGREGRNIRAFEKATGVDVIVDDTPGIVIVSAFDNVRRERPPSSPWRS